ncbi:fatty acid oxidation complex subunit alpha [Variibacter gotjawalensis]|uniref:enoyl-CoA hydratase n=1 Tax=Variibacter gotjawalensis TaxID=1333996 RepID=A0A0S3PVF7_9BRAD|nr:3-hydroxyacyl-CoA dehydrogenase NAD-binding domain-containing protein [Variibacter gotjawalensis]NIK45752.1 3-hydroxyacyl-CoA dehydrogenase/enoyl-CoA hydratase/3-hydroxybutyryl-CoA epimerase [Variibacter gotjawalensis]RZS47676.1 short chain enoyl-CoA hydratase /3-hydroxyacyl-CoA dehydrogenase [Variibacter gotjawalensis]BAT59929.1 fatty acid oxidation complex subunit alpha [Variibacter gotjawalensis]
MTNYTNFKVETDADGIALITWDMPGRSMNVIDEKVMQELAAIVDQVAADTNIKGAVVTSAKEAFSAGADLTMLETLGANAMKIGKEKGPQAATEAIFEWSQRLNGIYRKLETSGKPWVAALNGLAMGGGFELALACHYRVASDNPKLRVGLPEVKVGLFPGAGGTQRVARMIPPQDALQFLLKGDHLKADKAKALKLIDAVVPAADLIKAAKEWIKAGGKAVKPWDEKGFKLPGGAVYSKGGMMTFPPANAIYRRETYDNYPAAKAILQCVFEGIQVPMDLGLKIEARYFTKIISSPQAANMIRSLFVSLQELNKGARRPENIPPKKIAKVGIIGAGLMGAGIAYSSAAGGLDVVLIDRDQASADKGKAYTDKIVSGQIAKGRASEAQKAALLGKITATPDYDALKGCDLVIEAVFEDRKVKQEAYAKAGAVLPDNLIFGSNTSTLPITSLAKDYKKPENFIGIHFFSPVDKMMLVEIIMGEKTSDEALAVALDYVRAIKKTPIVVNDSRGFYTSRVVGTYIGEGHRMLADGIPAAMIENVGKMAGMPVGPLALNDEVAIDLSLKILKATEADGGANAVDADEKLLLTDMVEKRGRFGRKNGKGFYDYPEKGPKKLWPGISELQKKTLSADELDALGPDFVEEQKHRLLVIQALETARCFEEKVLTDVREGDIGSILGFGYAPWSGGTLSYIDLMGTKKFVALCEKLAEKYGPRFAPSKLLLEMAKTDDRFYRRFAPVKQKQAAA